MCSILCRDSSRHQSYVPKQVKQYSYRENVEVESLTEVTIRTSQCGCFHNKKIAGKGFRTADARQTVSFLQSKKLSAGFMKRPKFELIIQEDA